MSFVVQYVQLAVKLNGRTVALLFIADPISYVTFNGAALLSTDIGSFAVRQVGTDDVSVQGSKPTGAGPQSKLAI